MKDEKRLLSAAALLLPLLFGCRPQATAPTVPAQTVQHIVNGSPPPEFRKAAEAPTYKQAVANLEKRLRVEPQPATGVPGGYVFEVAQADWERQTPRLTEEFAARGAYVFRLEQNFGIGGRYRLLRTHCMP